MEGYEIPGVAANQTRQRFVLSWKKTLLLYQITKRYEHIITDWIHILTIKFYFVKKRPLIVAKQVFLGDCPSVRLSIYPSQGVPKVLYNFVFFYQGCLKPNKRKYFLKNL